MIAIAVIICGSFSAFAMRTSYLLPARGFCILFAENDKPRGWHMAILDDEPRKVVGVHEIGQDLSLLSVDELRERIGQLRQEIGRLEVELAAKGATKAAAEALFKS